MTAVQDSTTHERHGQQHHGEPQPPLSDHAREILSENAHYARECRDAARLVLGWHLDRLRLTVGLVRVVGKHEAPVPGDPARLVPLGADEHGQGWCVLVRDTTPTLDQTV